MHLLGLFSRNLNGAQWCKFPAPSPKHVPLVKSSHLTLCACGLGIHLSACHTGLAVYTEPQSPHVFKDNEC